MFWKMLVACLCLIPTAVPSQDVKHAPTLESCASSINVWISEAMPGIGMKNVPKVEYKSDTYKRLTYIELRFRTSFLYDCIMDHRELIARDDATGWGAATLPPGYEGEMKERLKSFIDRHGLFEKFIEEDVAGKR
jgi:hypothetical protein